MGRVRLLFGISVFWLALSMLFDGVNTILLPNQLMKAVDESHKSTALGLLTFVGLVAGMLVQSLLGMRAMAPLGMLVVDLHLPPWLPDLRLEGIHVGQSRVDLHVWRAGNGKTKYRVTRREGNVRVVRQPPPQGSEGSVTGRLRVGLLSAVHS